MRTLLLLTNTFPYGTWEPFLETEAQYYRNFDRVCIFSLSVRRDQVVSHRRLADSRIRVFPIFFRARLYYFVFAVRALLDPEFYAELTRLVKTRRLILGRLVQLVAFLSRAHVEATEIRRIIAREKLIAPDDRVLLYSYRTAYQPYLSELLKSCGGHQVRVARAHRADLYEEYAPHKYLPLRDRTMNCLDAIFLISKHGVDYLSSRHPDTAGRLSLSRLGTNEHGLGPIPADRSVLRIVSCSTMVPVKGLDRLIDALAEISEFSVHWTHFGDGPLSARIEERVRELCANIRVDLRGHLDNEALMNEYARTPFHALVNVSFSEGLPVSMMEACSFGIPIIATNVGGVSEIVTHEFNGFLVEEPAGGSDVAAAIRALAALDADAYTQMRGCARSVWNSSFNAEINYSEFAEDLLTKVDKGSGCNGE